MSFNYRKKKNNLVEFYEYGKNQLEIELIINAKLSSLKGMFFGCKYLKSISGLYNIDTSNLKDISYLFHGCEKLELVPGLSKWNTSKIITMKSMFFQCISLKIIKGLEKWNTSSVTDMSLMFYNCSSLTTLSEISDWNVSKVINMDCIFYGCKKLAHLPKWKTLHCIRREKMFMKYFPYESDNDEELINDLNTLEIKEKEKTDFIPKEKDNKKIYQKMKRKKIMNILILKILFIN